MKQGPSSSRAGDQKREPIPHKVTPSTAANIGLVGNGSSQQLYAGRGYEAPGTGNQTYHCGSQGKHK